MDSWHTLGNVIITIAVLLFCLISSVLTTFGISLASGLVGASPDNQKVVYPIVCLGYGICMWIIISADPKDMTNVYGWLFSIILLIGCILTKLLEIKGLQNILVFFGMAIVFSVIINVVGFFLIKIFWYLA